MTATTPDDELLAVERDRVVAFHYDLHDDQGVRLETTRDGEPALALHGHGNIADGVERALTGRRAGERFSVTVTPEDGFGVRIEGNRQRISKKYLVDAPARPRVGSQVVVSTEDGYRPVTVLKVGSSVVDVDLNHPMAGMTLRFDIEVLSVRAATAEEIAHGHAHGTGGHTH